MRLWTLHPRYLDARGLGAVWREGLLARAVLLGKTRGYVHHPQLLRFRSAPDPVAAVNAYLAVVLAESRERGYRYDATRFDADARAASISETTGQLDHEWAHLLRKLRERDPARHARLATLPRPAPHPLFTLIEGPVRDWEKSPSTDRPD